MEIACVYNPLIIFKAALQKAHLSGMSRQEIYEENSIIMDEIK